MSYEACDVMLRFFVDVRVCLLGTIVKQFKSYKAGGVGRPLRGIIRSMLSKSVATLMFAVYS